MPGGYEVDRSSNLGAEPHSVMTQSGSARTCNLRPWLWPRRRRVLGKMLSAKMAAEVTDMHERSSDRTVVSNDSGPWHAECTIVSQDGCPSVKSGGVTD